ncbi:tRNA preQ1(34) S-adenosylmethionine ribosyltransferase-isomerase QueA [Orrella sp. NBD-18]|uniref:S-adenosylmethionine:tRNA ribosyltransferase-isomerase n=1 Tax=Sheuella amnicola TaxID=2707330 RepID=A0A6B2R0T5_9BURK|nr:tRNA preQ1(34) S-adenosylmethionine ribosyltransferase-isomerase QueA [Sheuella amnicola]
MTGCRFYFLPVSSSLTVADFDYNLPSELIAQAPAAARTDSRLLHLDSEGRLNDLDFTAITSLVRPGDLLVFNDTRVIKARLFGRKASGGQVEVLIERITSEHEALAHIRASKSPGPGTSLRLSDAIDVTVMGRDNDLFILKFDGPILDLLDRYGSIPLPPYISHQPDALDDLRYQTVYAREPGAVAAPTAGLHFDENILEKFARMGVARAFVTLHVGAGTFQPVRVDKLSDHVMHAERYTVPAATAQAIARTRAEGGRIIAVGTTSVRALESAAKAQREDALAHPDRNIPDPRNQLLANSGDTRLFITPGFAYQVVDAMVTNFHLPQSTLLMLVSAFIGMEQMKAAYSHAIKQRYRFFSYGDAMFLERNPLL